MPGDPYQGDPVPMSDRLDAVQSALDVVRHRFDAALAEDLHRAHEEGQAAGRSGRTKSSCPYHSDELRRSWSEGYDRSGRSDSFNEGDHPRGEGGLFSVSKTTHHAQQHTISGAPGQPRKTVPAQAFNVHHGERHLGKVETSESAEVRRQGPRSMSTGRTLLRWNTSPQQVEGEFHKRGSNGHPSKNAAIGSLIRSHGLNPPSEYDK